jgi:hypothetical protein
MGLDMYLKASKYVSGYDHNTDADKKQFKSILRAAGIPLSCVCDESPSMDVMFNVAYWRKANAIHAWFVRECQKNVDECQTSYVPREKLVELRDLCADAINLKENGCKPEVAAAKLQPQSGFFFGSTDLDEWYWQDLACTVKKLTRILNAPALKDCKFYYRSSW